MISRGDRICSSTNFDAEMAVQKQDCQKGRSLPEQHEVVGTITLTTPNSLKVLPFARQVSCFLSPALAFPCVLPTFKGITSLACSLAHSLPPWMPRTWFTNTIARRRCHACASLIQSRYHACERLQHLKRLQTTSPVDDSKHVTAMHKCCLFTNFFPRASAKGSSKNNFCRIHLHIFTSAHSHSHLYLISPHLLICTSTSLLIFTSAHLLERRETRKLGQREEKRTREAGTKMQCSTW